MAGLVPAIHAEPLPCGSETYVCHRGAAPIVRKRLGDVAIETASGRSGSFTRQPHSSDMGAGRWFLRDLSPIQRLQACEAQDGRDQGSGSWAS